MVAEYLRPAGQADTARNRTLNITVLIRRGIVIAKLQVTATETDEDCTSSEGVGDHIDQKFICN